MTPHSNRRGETRYRTLTGQLVMWRPEQGAGFDFKAWVHDISEGGVGLMVERSQLPAVGERISLRLRPASRPVQYEVLNIQPGAHHVVSIGCQRVGVGQTEVGTPASPLASVGQAA